MDCMADRAGRKRLKSLFRARLHVSGIVQGVGFRPFVYRLASRYGLTGFIGNTADGVVIEVQSDETAVLESFRRDLELEAPSLARVFSVQEQSLEPLDEQGFHIVASGPSEGVETLVPPDIALCADCRRELFDPSDRRYRYPFINCTNCGPRYTIVESIPYDRPSTTMKGFRMCPSCLVEYRDPLDRRFHAQPDACHECGPSLQFVDSSGTEVSSGGDPLLTAIGRLREGAIVAVKGIGGFHLAVDACNEHAVRLLRKRKGRDAKPFAVMARDIAAVRRVACVGDVEEEALISPAAPVVILHKREPFLLSSLVAPGNPSIGMMLPYSPLHYLLMNDGPEFLVMTSANASEEPIMTDNGEALEKLRGIADFFLMHNRPIHIRCDDSVTVCLDGELRQIRRSRGYVPSPVMVSSNGLPVLAVGAEIKNTVCLLKKDQALLSQHIGDLKNFDAYENFLMTSRHLQEIFQSTPEIVACDLHPLYMASDWARQQSGMQCVEVQHHHAHLGACLAENRHDGPVIGIILDGAGFGSDGTVWGGEVLLGHIGDFERYASLEPLPLPGGDSAVFHPWKTAAGYLFHAGCDVADRHIFDGRQVDVVVEMIERSLNTPFTSSCGRLFDAVAALCGICPDTSYEGQAAVELMNVAGGRMDGSSFSYEIDTFSSQVARLLVVPLVRDVVSALDHGTDICEVSRRFHVTIVTMFCDIAVRASRASGLKTVALSGGVFQNSLIFEGMVDRLRRAGLQVLTHSLVPCNDGGISLGQAVIARRRVTSDE